MNADIPALRIGPLATTRYSFSGYESFHCRLLWLKKGYNFLNNGHAFNSPDAVVHLGVGKNMVSAIRFWLKVFGLTENDVVTKLAHLVFTDDGGFGRFLEDINTLWPLHYNAINTCSTIFHDYLSKRLLSTSVLNNS